MNDRSEKRENTAPSESLVGREFLGRYRLLEPVGQGGMSVVYKALHLKMDRIVAVKVLSKSLAQDEAQVRLFNKEAFASSRLSHPNTIKVFDFGESEDGYLFIVMEHLDGETLGSLLRNGGTLRLSRMFRIMRQICKSLAEAHSVGIIHRDLKPENIFITNIYGEEDYVKVLDFGIAKVLGPEVEDHTPSPSGRIWGSPLYLSPEHILNRPVSIQSDLYSLGCVLFEMLAGRPPFVSKKAIDVVMAHVEDPPPKLADVMAEGSEGVESAFVLDLLVGDLLAKDPKDRPTSSEDLLERLEIAALDLGIKAPGTDPTRLALDGPDTHRDVGGTMGAGKQRPRGYSAVVFAVFAALCVGAFVMLGPGLGQKPEETDEVSGRGVIAPRTAQPEVGTGQESPREALPFRREFLVQSDPSGALVILGGQELGKTPFLVTYAEGQEASDLVIRKKGYEEVQVRLSRVFVEALTREGLNVNMEEQPKAGKSGGSSGKKPRNKKKKWEMW